VLKSGDPTQRFEDARDDTYECADQIELPKQQWHLVDTSSQFPRCATSLNSDRSKNVSPRFGEEIEAVEDKSAEKVDRVSCRETSVALWLLHSDVSNLRLKIFCVRRMQRFQSAREKVFYEFAHDWRLMGGVRKNRKATYPDC